MPPRPEQHWARLLPWLPLASLLLMASLSAGAHDHGVFPPLSPPELDHDPATPWLDDVRAQRQAWEERRRAAREAYEARRRQHHPRAAQQEAWEDEFRRRRAARLEWMELDRGFFLGFGPGPGLLLPPPPDPFASPEQDTSGQFPSPGTGTDFAPPGWDNPWYFRGF